MFFDRPLLPASMTGRFDYYNPGITIPHVLPQRCVVDGCPIIILPGRDKDIVAGRTYSFSPRLTHSAKYVADGETYRVAHAIAPIQIEGKQGDTVDALLHGSKKPPRASIADTPAGEALAQLKARMAG